MGLPHRTLFPWREHNRFELLIDGNTYYPAILEHIEQAHHSILIEQYLVISGEILTQFCDALIRAAQRGVHVCLLFDDYGAKRMQPTDRAKLVQGGVHLQFYNPFNWLHLYRSLKRTHRKIFLFDQHTAFIGGAGIADNFAYPAESTHSWHDLMLKVEGEVVQDWWIAFARLWRLTSSVAVPGPALKPQHKKHQRGQVQLAHGLQHHNQILRDVLNAMNRCTQQLYLVTPYFITTRKIRRSIRFAAQRGVDVRILLPGPHSDHPWVSHAARRQYRSLLHAGVRIFEYLPRFIHAKVIVCDDWVSLGSCNLDRWNQIWNHDANQAIADTTFAGTVKTFIQHDLTQSREILYQDWIQRPWRHRAYEWLHGHVVEWIGRWSLWLKKHHRKKKAG